MRPDGLGGGGGGGINITMRGGGRGAVQYIQLSSYQYRISHCVEILRPSYLHNGVSYTGK